ncbi:hypothetical protein BH09MYX1_BH09MYX1_67730 [soil metagenome]
MSDSKRPNAWGYIAETLRVVGMLFLLWPFVPPVLHAVGLHSFAAALEYPWSLTCHRGPERTLDLVGYKMPMCSRCTGIDLGIGLGLVLGRPYRGPIAMWIWLIAAVAFMLADVYLLSANGVIWHPSRIFTGGFLSFPVAAAVSAIARRERDAPEATVTAAESSSPSAARRPRA